MGSATPKKESYKDPRMEEAFNTMTEAEASYGLTKWIGAIFFFLVRRGKNDFKYYEQPQFNKRNFWVGYISKILFVVFILWLFLNYFL